jgi:hypothetical protein
MELQHLKRLMNAKASIPKHKYYIQEGNTSLPNPRCVNFSNLLLVLLLLLKQTYYPPPPARPPPTPSPRCVLANTDQPPTPVEAWLAYVRLPNSTGTFGTLIMSTPDAYSQIATPHTWLRGLCAVYCRTTLLQSFLEQLWFSNIQSYGQKSPTAHASLPIRITLSANT